MRGYLAFCKLFSLLCNFLKKRGPIPASFYLFSSFSHQNSILDVVLGFEPRRHSLVYANRSTELWRPPTLAFFARGLIFIVVNGRI